jgi:hypothetical protein
MSAVNLMDILVEIDHVREGVQFVPLASTIRPRTQCTQLDRHPPCRTDGLCLPPRSGGPRVTLKAQSYAPQGPRLPQRPGRGHRAGTEFWVELSVVPAERTELGG